MATKTEKRAVEIIVNGVQAGNSVKELGKDIRALTAYVNGLTPGTKEFVNASKRLQEVKQRYNEIKSEISGVSSGFSLLKGGALSLAKGVFGGNLLFAGFQKAVGFIGDMISGAMKLSDELADMRKTTGMSADEVVRLNKELNSIDTRTPASELRQIAIVAGQLGIAKGDILEFTKATDKLNVALGDEFGSAEEVTKATGALRNIFKDIKSQDVGADMMHIGNALNELGAAGAATGPVVADFASRIGGVGEQLGLSSAQVLGLSATLQELNVSTERGGTAVTNILLKMTSNTAAFADVAGMKLTEFTDLVNNDLFGAFMAVIKGSQESASSATEFSEMLDGLKVDGAGASEVLSKLSSSTDLLTEKVNLSGKALGETGSIMDEFSIKNDTLAAKWEKFTKGFSAKVLEPIGDVLGNIFGGLLDIANGADEAEGETRNLTMELNAQARVVKDMETKVVPLLDRYDELASKTKLNAGEQKELNKIINSLATDYPSAIAQINEEGKAIKMNTDTIRTYLKFEKDRLNFINADKIKDHTSKLTAARLELGKLTADLTKAGTIKPEFDKNWKESIKNFKGVTRDITKMDVATPVKVFTKAELDQMEHRRQELISLTNGIEADLKLLRGDNLDDMVNFKDSGTGKDGGGEVEADADTKDALTKQQKKFNENTQKLLDEAKEAHIAVIKDEENRELASLTLRFEQRKRDIEATDADQKSKDAAIKDLDAKLQEDLTNTHQKYAKERADKEYEESVKNLANTFDRRRIMAGQDRADNKISEEQYQKELTGIQDEELQARLLLAKDYGKDTKEVEKDIVDHRIKTESDELERQKQHQQAMLELKVRTAKEGSRAQLDAETELLTFQMEQELTNTLLTEDQKKAIQDYYRDQLKDAENEYWDQWGEKAAGVIEQVGGAISDFAGALQTIRENNQNEQLAADKEQTESAKKALKKQLADKVITQEEYDKRVEQIDTEADAREKAIRRDQAIREKKLKVFEATISMLAGIAKAIPNIPLMILAGILGGANIAAIASTPVPELATGGKVKVKGANTGRLWNASFGGRAGGWVSTPTLFLAGETRKPEYVIPGDMMDDPAVADTVTWLESQRTSKTRVPEFAAGGSTGAPVSVPQAPAANSPDNGLLLQLIANQNSMLVRLQDRLDNPVPGTATISYDHIQEANDDVGASQGNSALG